MKSIKTILSISHYIYLSREQRYAVFNKETIEVLGVSVPVWFKAGNTSEPAKEIFCKYIINSKDSLECITPFKEGYKINFEHFDFNLNSILDVKDRGCEELTAKEYAKVYCNGANVNAFHCIEIKSVDLLLKTLC